MTSVAFFCLNPCFLKRLLKKSLKAFCLRTALVLRVPTVLGPTRERRRRMSKSPKDVAVFPTSMARRTLGFFTPRFRCLQLGEIHQGIKQLLNQHEQTKALGA